MENNTLKQLPDTPRDRYQLATKKFVTQQLVEQYPCRLSNANKALLYSIACPAGAQHGGELIFSRWRSMDVAEKNFNAHKTACCSHENAYPYNRNDDPHTDEWWVNFADPHLFVAYGSSLFAQDEIQVAEHPSLGHLKEALYSLSHQVSDRYAPKTRESNAATPILIRGAERRVAVRLDANVAEGRPRGLYGNEFGRAASEAVRTATARLQPCSVTHLICIAALNGGFGRYTLAQITDLFVTAYSGFAAARLESEEHNAGSKVVVHTGNWGTGAFGGNKVLMALIQMFAADLAQIDELHYHTFNPEGTRAFNAAQEVRNQLHERHNNVAEDGSGTKSGLSVTSASLTVPALLQDLYQRKYQWGMSDGN
jgi:hypothetical protein